jgi:hypothetical protein
VKHTISHLNIEIAPQKAAAAKAPKRIFIAGWRFSEGMKNEALTEDDQI